jgi:secondary thiamine-phosphate synthase enzyme
MKSFPIRTRARTEFVDITYDVRSRISEIGLKNGICVVFVPHTTAGVTINEAADPSVPEDIIARLADLVPYRDAYKHVEGNSDAHIKTSLVGSSVTLIVIDGKLSLGTWQGIFLCEFDGPRTRKVLVETIDK